MVNAEICYWSIKYICNFDQRFLLIMFDLVNILHANDEKYS